MDSAPAGGARIVEMLVAKPKLSNLSLCGLDCGCCLEWQSLCHLLYSAVRWLCTRYTWTASPTRKPPQMRMYWCETADNASNFAALLDRRRHIDVPVFITNLSGKEQTVTLSMDAESIIPLERTDAVKAKTIQFLGKTVPRSKSKPMNKRSWSSKPVHSKSGSPPHCQCTKCRWLLKSEEKLEVPFGSKAYRS